MSGKIINSIQLRNELSENIEKFREQLQDDNVPKEEYKSLFDAILAEREMVLEEFEFQIYSQKRYERYFDDEFKLLINNLDESVYNTLSLISNKLKVPLAQFLNILFDIANENFGKEFPIVTSKMIKPKIMKSPKISINHLSDLVIHEEDLNELEVDGFKVNINHVQELDLTNISFEHFMKYINRISHCKYVKVPDEWPKLVIYFKSLFCSYFEFA